MIDVPTLTGWIVSGLVGATFGILSAWITYRFGTETGRYFMGTRQSKATKTIRTWKRTARGCVQAKVRELGQRAQQEEHSRLGEQLMEGTENQDQAIRILEREQVTLGRSGRIMVSSEYVLAEAAFVTKVGTHL
jgi:hypothetical protein